MTKTVNLIWWRFDPKLAYEYDWLNLLLSSFEVNHLVNQRPEDDVYLDRAIVVINLNHNFFDQDGSRQKYHAELKQFCQYIQGFKTRELKVGLFHLNDEFYKESIGFYPDLDFVFRQYYRPEAHQDYPHCHPLTLGYKTGFTQGLVQQPIQERKYFWSFAGQLKGTRYDMAKAADRIPSGKLHTTTQWNDPKGLNTQEYAALLNNTVFSLCPMGNYSVDCYRIYEALEAGAIPIIEAKDVREALAALFNPQLLLKYGVWDQQFWLRNYRYWEKAYGTEFPCPLIYDWKDLEKLMGSIDIKSLSQEVRRWWQVHKQSLTQLVQATVEQTFS